MKKFFTILGFSLLVTLVVSLAIYLYVIRGVGVSIGLQPGMVMEVWDDSLLDDIPVALDINPQGQVYVTGGNSFKTGVGDARQQPFWVLDDIASASIEDRQAYIEKWIAAGKVEQSYFDAKTDYVRVLEDTDGDNRADKATTFAEIRGLLDGISAGVLVKGKDVWVTSIPYVWHYRDEDGDLEADSAEKLSTGYGLRTAFLGHDLHGLTWGPDGRIYFSVGDRGYNVVNQEGKHLVPPMDNGRGAVFRMNPDGSELEVFATGLRNPQELAFDDYGNLFTGENNSDGGDAARLVYLVEGGDSGWFGPYQYQESEDYLRGPWNAEKLWHPYHEGQPAWIVPPVAEFINGPSGMNYYPGTGFSERYRGHFFLSNYSFTKTNSEIWSFAVNNVGAGFEMTDVHEFVDNELFIDQVFGYDGKLYTLSAATFFDEQTIHTVYDEEHINDPVVAEVGELFRTGFEVLSDERLVELLAHRDQRVRREAQFELVARQRSGLLAAVVNKPEASLFSRIHGLWGLGQMGVVGLDATAWENLAWLQDEDDEMTTQVLKFLAEVGEPRFASDVRARLAHDNARVQYFAAMAVAKTGDSGALEDLLEQLRQNQDADPWLRHGLVFALAETSTTETLMPHVEDPSRSVRMGVLLALRRQGAAEIQQFLQDEDPLLVVEAARAIHDLPLDEAMPALAAMAATEIALRGDDAQSSYALHRRIINANLRLGSEQGASQLAAYAANAANPRPMRELALASLKTFARPPAYDPVFNVYRPLPERSPELVYGALDTWLPGLMGGELEEAAMEVAVAYERVPLDDPELVKLVADSGQAESLRINGLRALVGRLSADNRELVERGISAARASELASLRAEGLALWAEIDAEAALHAAIAMDEEASMQERQAALLLIARIGGEPALAALSQYLEQLREGDLDVSLQLELVEAVALVDNPELTAALDEWRASLPDNPTDSRSLALAGGDPVKGKAVFENRGDCLRCHAVNGRGGVAGPELGDMAARYDSRYLLEALVEPQAAIAPGFGAVVLNLKDGTTVAGALMGKTETEYRVKAEGSHGEGGEILVPFDQVESATDPLSGMPPMGLVLSPRDLRDVMAYLLTLR